MLESYEKKRDFTRTREPSPSVTTPAKGSLRFVVQKHAARRLHYDFRLEVDGVLKSWAVPKGPSLDPAQKRLAAFVEDHPLDYGTFEGVIGHGNYGAGQVVVWDSGVYSPDEDGQLSFGDREDAAERMRRGLDAGKLSITLRGRKLRGSWTLVRTSRGPKDWLLIKHADRYTDTENDVLEQDASIQSGLTIDDLTSGRLPDPAEGFAVGETPAIGRARRLGKESRFPTRIKPMTAHLAEASFSHPDWVFEPKLDGFRVIAYARHGKATLRSRNDKDLTEYAPSIVAELEAQPEDELVLDGELVALDERGLPSFALLQQSLNLDRRATGQARGSATLAYYPFDLLYVEGADLRGVPLVERKRLLSDVLVTGDCVRKMESVDAEGEAFFEAAVGLGLEGVVAKRTGSTYQSGTRTRSWLKIKAVQSQDFVVGGYSPGQGARSAAFGALMVGYYDDGQLQYAGRVGSGFDDETLEALSQALSELRQDDCPFAADPELADPSYEWVHPRLVAKVKFSQWTAEGRLRAPVFLGVRTDLDALEVRREEAKPAALPRAGPRKAAKPARTEVEAVLEQLSTDRDKLILESGGHRLSLTNLNKELWPAGADSPAVTKGDMIRYYIRMGPTLLPHLRDRAMTLTRFPNGIGGESFYQKRWEHDLPEFVETVRLFSSHNEGDVEYIVVNNLLTLVWLAQLANIELHPWLSRVTLEPDATHLTTSFTGSKEAIKESVLNYPDFIVFDLDPYIYSGQEKQGEEPELNRRAFAKVREVALALKDILDELSLSSFVKTSGKTGLHIYVPVVRRYDYATTRKTCELIGQFLLRQRPRDITMEWAVEKRAGKIFLDHNQNVMSKNMASIYSLRPLPGAPVSTPVRWDELEDIYPTQFTIESVPERVEESGDLWADALSAKHDLHRLLGAD